MKIDENGIIRDMTEAEIEQFEKEMEESAKNSGGSITPEQVGIYYIGGGETSIQRQAYQNNTDIEKLIISDSVKEIKEWAFSYATRLERIVFSENTIYINQYAFENCKNLYKITLPSKIYSIGSFAFAQCDKLTEVYLPKSLQNVANSAFNSDGSLTKITLESGFATSLNVSKGSFTSAVMVNMFNAIADLTGKTAQTLTLGSTNLAKLTDEQKQIATDKNWNLA